MLAFLLVWGAPVAARQSSQAPRAPARAEISAPALDLTLSAPELAPAALAPLTPMAPPIDLPAAAPAASPAVPAAVPAPLPAAVSPEREPAAEPRTAQETAQEVERRLQDAPAEAPGTLAAFYDAGGAGKGAGPSAVLAAAGRLLPGGLAPALSGARRARRAVPDLAMTGPKGAGILQALRAAALEAIPTTAGNMALRIFDWIQRQQELKSESFLVWRGALDEYGKDFYGALVHVNDAIYEYRRHPASPVGRRLAKVRALIPSRLFVLSEDSGQPLEQIRERIRDKGLGDLREVGAFHDQGNYHVLAGVARIASELQLAAIALHEELAFAGLPHEEVDRLVFALTQKAFGEGVSAASLVALVDQAYPRPDGRLPLQGDGTFGPVDITELTYKSLSDDEDGGRTRRMYFDSPQGIEIHLAAIHQKPTPLGDSESRTLNESIDHMWSEVGWAGTSFRPPSHRLWVMWKVQDKWHKVQLVPDVQAPGGEPDPWAELKDISVDRFAEDHWDYFRDAARRRLAGLSPNDAARGPILGFLHQWDRVVQQLRDSEGLGS